MNILQYFNDSLIFKLVIYTFILCSLIYTLGSLLLYIFKVQIENNITSLFIKFSILLFGLSFAASSFFAQLISVNTIIFVVASLTFFYVKKINKKLGFLGTKRLSIGYYFKDYREYIISLGIILILIIGLAIQHELLNIDKKFIWSDYCVYAELSDFIKNAKFESFFIKLPEESRSFSFMNYVIYHYSDLWVVSLFIQLAKEIKNYDVYVFIYLPIAAITIVYGIAGLALSKQQNNFFKNSFILFFAMLISAYLLFFTQSPKLMFSLIFFLPALHAFRKKNTVVFLSLMLLGILSNPVYVFLLPLLYLFLLIRFIYHKQERGQVFTFALLFLFYAAALFLKKPNQEQGSDLKPYLNSSQDLESYLKVFNGLFHHHCVKSLFVLVAISLLYNFIIHKKSDFKVLLIGLAIFAFGCISYFLMYNVHESFQFETQAFLMMLVLFYLYMTEFMLGLINGDSRLTKVVLIAFLLITSYFSYGYIKYGKVDFVYYETKFIADIDAAINESPTRIVAYFMYNDKNYSTFAGERPLVDFRNYISQVVNSKEIYFIPIFEEELNASSIFWKKTDYSIYLEKLIKSNELNNEQKQLAFIEKNKIKLFITNTFEREKFLKLMDFGKKKIKQRSISKNYELFELVE
jgi:hypothetical protein